MTQAKRERACVAWPTWEGPIRGWAAKYIHQQKWRCDSIHEFDDLLQEGYLLFAKLEYKYPRVIDPKHFMALFKISFTNLLHDKASYMQRKRVCHSELPQDVSELWANCTGDTTNAGYIGALLAAASPELTEALALITDNPGLLDDRTNSRRETLNMKLRRILGLESSFNLKAALTDLLFN